MASMDEDVYVSDEGYVSQADLGLVWYLLQACMDNPAICWCSHKDVSRICCGINNELLAPNITATQYERILNDICSIIHSDLDSILNGYVDVSLVGLTL